MKHWRTLLVVVFVFSLLQACAPTIYERGALNIPPSLSANAIKTADGRTLPLRHWGGLEKPKAVIIALHGFNDYSNFFDQPGSYFADRGILSYAYDQRGFGATEGRRFWHGGDVMANDLKLAARLIRQRHPQTKIFLLGESMGGAVVIKAMTGLNPPKVDGLILSAPAIWGRETMPWYQTTLLWVAARTVPWLTLTGRGLNIKPSDNREMLIALGKDPLIIKETRIDAIKGLVDLMDDALATTPQITQQALVLYGARDEIIPRTATAIMFANLIHAHQHNAQTSYRLAVYDQGYHMLLRDLQAKTVLADIAGWVDNPSLPLASGADDAADKMTGVRKTLFSMKNTNY